MHGWSWSLELLAYVHVCAATFAGIQEQLQLTVGSYYIAADSQSFFNADNETAIAARPCTVGVSFFYYTVYSVYMYLVP